MAAAPLVLALLLPGTVSLASPASATAPPPDAQRSGRQVSVIAGEQVRITGRTPTHLRQAVVLQRRDGNRWRAVGGAHTSRAGRYAFTIRVRAATTYRVVTRTPSATTEGPRRWASRPILVRLLAQRGDAAAPDSAAPGASVSVTAAFGPARAGRPVRLEARADDGTWTTIAQGTEDGTGRVTFGVRPTATTTYRVVTSFWRGARAVGSAPVTVLVATSPEPAPTPAPTPTPTREDDASRPWVTGYYGGWFHTWLYPPAEVDMTAMTHFVFGGVAPGGGALGGAPGSLRQAALTAQQPGSAPDHSGRSVEDYLVDKAHAVGTRTLLMLGGDPVYGRGFLEATYDEEVRAAFVDAVVDYLVEHDYDGVDLDWHGCLDGHPECVDQSGEVVTAGVAHQRLVGLVDAIRAEMATRARYAGEPGLITAQGETVELAETAGTWAPGTPEPWQVAVAERVDQYNLTSFGSGTTWNFDGWSSWFTGALTGGGAHARLDISSSVDAYVAAGVPRDRLGIGIGFTGVNYGPSISGPRQSTAGNGIYEFQDPAMSYSELDRLGYFEHGSLHWDEEAQSTYRTYVDAEHPGGYVPEELDGDGNPRPTRNASGFLSYEDERSIAAKGAWVEETGVGGTMLWMINYGWLPRTGTNPLLDAVKGAFLD